MINTIYLQTGEKVIGYNDETKKVELDNGSFISRGKVGKVLIYCDECNKKNVIGLTKKHCISVYLCQSCNKKGDRNGFYGKKHSEELKLKLSEERKGVWGIGEKNGFYGKTHTEETKEILREKCANFGEKNGFYGKKHPQELMDNIVAKRTETISNYTEEKRQEISKNLSDAQKKMQEEDPKKYIENKRKAGILSIKSQSRNWTMNKLEEKVFDYLQDNTDDEWVFSVILGKYQYDFGCKDKRILIEVQGDYWHGNEDLFNEDGSDGKRKLNNNQINKKIIDIEKKEFADKHNLKLYVIWEADINNDNFSSLKLLL
tara:strand:- start:500 stop:1447 length:948 start_codon:yes stop_codon:yes gene_type:complete